MKPILFTLLGLLAGSCSMTAAADGVTLNGKARVIDGDTLVIGTRHIRLSGIDAPEKEQTCTKLKVWKTKCGLTSAAILSDLIGRKAVSCAVVDIDRYGRSVAHCRAGKTDLNREMVRQGWAVAYWTDDFKAEEKQAKAAKRGIWATAFQRPADYRRQKKGG